jgi:nucleoside-diphosphate-sugar epimerase
MNKKVELDIYRAVNRDGTKHLAEQAAKAGVKRLIFLSIMLNYWIAINQLFFNKRDFLNAIA